MNPRIAIINASVLSIEPVMAAFMVAWPEARLFNLVDDALSSDLTAAGESTAQLTARIGSLADHAVLADARAILYTCSAFGPAIDLVKRRIGIPVLAANEAMIDEALGAGSRLAVLATTAAALPTICAEIEAAARARRLAPSVFPVHVPGALDSLASGRIDLHDAAIVEAASGLGDCDVILLGQFTMARAAAAVASRTGRKVLTSPTAAVTRLRSRCGAA